MAEVTIGDAPATPIAPTAPDHFTHTSERGFAIVTGKPRGILKLKLRDLLTLEEMRDDAELVKIATACLSIRAVNGEAPRLRNNTQFRAFLDQTFGSDSDINTFMDEYQKFTDPEGYEFIRSTLKEAVDAGKTSDDEIVEFMKAKYIERQSAETEKVRL